MNKQTTNNQKYNQMEAEQLIRLSAEVEDELGIAR